MNKRILNVHININGLRVVKYQDATQHDKNTHFIGVSFMDDIDLVGYTLQVYYLPPFPSEIPYIDIFNNLTQSMEIPIPNRVLQRNGEVTVEFVLSKAEELITINQNFTFEVVKTINGTTLTAYPEGALKETIAQQIEKIKALLNQTDVKIKDYNDNALSKTNSFNDNAKAKTNNFNDNVQAKTNNFNNNVQTKTNNFNNNVQTKTTEAYQAMEQQAGISANSAATEANELVVAQQNKSIKEVQTATTESKNNAISEIERKTLEQVEVVKTQGTTNKREVEQVGTTAINNINTTKTEVINSIDTSKNSAIQALNKAVTDQGDLTKQGVAEEGNKVVRANKTELDTYVNTTSKPHIDNYVTQKEGEIKGATFTPTVDEEGNISWKNDKNLENPIPKNIKGPKGDPGNFIFKVERGHLMYYTVTNGSSPEFKLNKKHLIIKIK